MADQQQISQVVAQTEYDLPNANKVGQVAAQTEYDVVSSQRVAQSAAQTEYDVTPSLRVTAVFVQVEFSPTKADAYGTDVPPEVQAGSTSRVSVEAYNPATLQVETLRFSTGAGFISSLADVVPATVYAPRVKEAGNLRCDMFANGSLGGSTQIGLGEIILSNIDGGLDYLRGYGFDGRKVEVSLEDGTVLYVATISQPVFEYNQVAFKLRDKQFLLDKPVQPLKFAGDNVLPLGVEGVATDIKGKPKPLTLGRVFNITPVCVNTSKLIYAVNIRRGSWFADVPNVAVEPDFAAIALLTGLQSGAIIEQAYDKGVVLTQESDYADLNDMITNAPSAGCFRVWPTGGYFRLGSSPAGTITVDAIDRISATSGATLANLVAQTLNQVDYPGDEVDTSGFDYLNAVMDEELGVYYNAEATAINVLDSICPSGFVWWGFDRMGIFKLYRIEMPLQNPKVFLDVNNVLTYELLERADTPNGIPAKRLKMQWRKNYTVQNPSDVAGSVLDDKKAELVQEYRETMVEDPSMVIRHLLAPEITTTTAFYNEPTGEAQRQLDILKADTIRLRVKVKLVPGSGMEKLLDMTTVTNVTLPRFGLDNGQNLMVIGFDLNATAKTIEAILWG